MVLLYSCLSYIIDIIMGRQLDRLMPFWQPANILHSFFIFMLLWQINIVVVVVESRYNFYRAMRCMARSFFAVIQCPSVRLSVTFVDHVKTNKLIFEFFLPSSSDTILVFPNQRRCRYADGNPPNWGVECKGV